MFQCIQVEYIKQNSGHLDKVKLANVLSTDIEVEIVTVNFYLLG